MPFAFSPQSTVLLFHSFQLLILIYGNHNLQSGKDKKQGKARGNQRQVAQGSTTKRK